MKILVLFAIWMFGGCIMSFGNCIAYRVPRRMDWVKGHSICTRCGKRLEFWELIPVFSCVFLKARCHKCKAYFGWQNAISEALFGWFCVVAYSVCQIWDLGIVALAICCGVYIIFLIVIAYIDRIIHSKDM